MITRKDKIFGGLLGAAVGDSMGAATEFLTLNQIKEWFGGNVTTYVELPDHIFLKGAVKGMVTDDFSIGYYTAVPMIEKKQNTMLKQRSENICTTIQIKSHQQKATIST